MLHLTDSDILRRACIRAAVSALLDMRTAPTYAKCKCKRKVPGLSPGEYKAALALVNK